MTEKHIRLTVAQAIVKYLDNQFINIDGQEARICGGGFGIFGHGNVTCLGETIYDYQDSLPLYRGQNEQSMGFAAAGYAKYHLRQRFMFCTASAGPGTANLLTAAALAHANRLPMLMLCGDTFLTRLPDPVLQQLEHFGNPTLGVNDAFKAVSRFWDRITHPAQVIQSLPAALATMLDPADCGPAFIGLPQDTQGWAYDYPASFFDKRVHQIRRQAPDLQSNSANAIAEEADVILAVGTRLQDFTTGSWTAFDKDAQIIGLNKGERTKWDAYVAENCKPGNRPNSYAQAIGTVNDLCEKRDRVVAAAGGLPAEVTANWKTLDVGTVDVVFIGDGSYLMMNSDIYSSVLSDKKLIIFVLDNGGFAVINKLQNNTGNESFNNLIADCPTVSKPFAVDFEAHAAAMGATAETVDNPKELSEAFKRAKASDKTYVIAMKVDAYGPKAPKDRHMSALLDGIKQNNFLVIGRAGMDFFPDPPGTKTEEATGFQSGLGGSAANTAAGICKLGGKAALVTSVADDSIGRYCVNQLAHYGVDHTHVKPVGGEYRNSLAVYESRVEDHQTVIYRNGAADFQMTNEDVEAVDYSQYGALITAGTVFAAEPSRTAAAASLSDMIVGNDEEFGFMAGSVTKGLQKAEALANSSASIVIYKMGEKGAVTFHDGTQTKTGIFKVEALKPTGAGDSFMAALMASIAAGHDLETSILRGSACAAIVVGKPGCAPALPTPKELETFLADHPGPSEG